MKRTQIICLATGLVLCMISTASAQSINNVPVGNTLWSVNYGDTQAEFHVEYNGTSETYLFVGRVGLEGMFFGGIVNYISNNNWYNVPTNDTPTINPDMSTTYAIKSYYVGSYFHIQPGLALDFVLLYSALPNGTPVPAGIGSMPLDGQLVTTTGYKGQPQFPPLLYEEIDYGFIPAPLALVNTPSTVPEPASLLLISAGIVGLVRLGRKI